MWRVLFVFSLFFSIGVYGLLNKTDKKAQLTEIGNKFALNFTNAIQTKNMAKLDQLTSRVFVYRGCYGLYEKEKFLGLLKSQLLGSKLSFNLKGHRSSKVTLVFNATISKPGKFSIQAQLSINYQTNQLEGLKAMNCEEVTKVFSEKSVKSFVVDELNTDEMMQNVIDEYFKKLNLDVVSDSWFVNFCYMGLYEPGFGFLGKNEWKPKSPYNTEVTDTVNSTHISHNFTIAAVVETKSSNGSWWGVHKYSQCEKTLMSMVEVC